METLVRQKIKSHLHALKSQTIESTWSKKGHVENFLKYKYSLGALYVCERAVCEINAQMMIYNA